MNVIQLYGDLAEKYGDSHKANVRDPVEAVAALCANFSGFREEFMYGDYHIVRETATSRIALDETMISLGMDGGVIHFYPVVDGSGKGLGKTILGTAIFVGSLFIPGSSLILGMSLRTAGMMVGASMALQGMSLMIAPTPKVDTGSGDDSSKLINGDFNPSGQNFAVPIVVGKWRRRGIPVATEIVTNEYNVAAGEIYDNPYAGIGGNGGSSSGGYQERTAEF